LSSEAVMAAPLSQDLRKRLVRAVEEGSSARAAAARFDVSASAAIKLVRRVRETGSTAPAKIGGYRKPLLAGYEDLLRALISAKPGITLAERASGNAAGARHPAGLADDDLVDAAPAWPRAQKRR
jgi:transposase